MTVMNLTLGLIIAAIWMAGCCILISKIKTKHERNVILTVTIILFILSAGVYFGSWIGLNVAQGFLSETSATVDEYIRKNHGNVQFVRSGVPATDADVKKAIDDLQSIIPQKISEFGLSGIIAETLYRKALTRGFDILRTRTAIIISFAEDGKVTSSTTIKALEWEILSVIKRIVTIICSVFAVMMVIDLVICVVFAVKKTRPAQADTAVKAVESAEKAE